MKTVLATIRDREDHKVASIEAYSDNQDFVVCLSVSREHDFWHERLSELSEGKLRLMINGVICLEEQADGAKKLILADEVVSRICGDEARFVYDPEGIEQGHQLKSELAKQQEHCVPFSDLVDILHQSLGTS